MFDICKAFVVVSLLSSCAVAGEALEEAKQTGKEFAAGALSNAEWVMCRAASVGSVTDRYWQDEKKASAWIDICYDIPKIDPEDLKKDE